MAKFVIKQIDPFKYKNEIFNFWDKYLEGTVHERLDWMEKGNPAGSAQWFFAFIEGKGDIAGMISIIPREFYFQRKKYRAGMLGDYMVDAKHRVFGPAILIHRYLQDRISELGYDFLYTIPTSELTRFMEGLGYKKLCTLKHLIRPINTFNYIKRLTGAFFSRIISPVLNLGLLLSTIQPDFEPRYRHLEKKIGNDFLVEHDEKQLTGIRTLDYLTWRYSDNPTFHFKIRQFYQNNQEQPEGFVIYTSENKKIELFDLYADDEKKTQKVLTRFLRWTHFQGVDSVYCRISTNAPLFRRLKRYLFSDTKDDAHVMYFSKIPEHIDASYFNWGEKII